jgi:formylglycine-generating enzyme required for sulfatase activity
MKHPSHALRTATALRCTVALLLAFNAPAPAQDNAPAAPAAADAPAAQPQTEMQKWIAATDAQWQAAFQRDVTDVQEAEAKKLMLQYLNLLEETIVKVSKAGDLDGAVALRAEQKRFGDTQLFPEQDEAGDPAAVKQVRAGIRAQLANLKAESATRTKALHAKYDQVLAQAQTQLTQSQRLDDALLVKAKREEVSAAWLTPGVAATAGKLTPEPPQKTGTIQSGLTAATQLAAIKDRPFVNSLGMEFVPVPGTQVLLSRWETRVKDYAAYAQGKKVDDSWMKQELRGVPVGREPKQPVCAVSWEDGNAFCEWLTKKENEEGKLPNGMKYRLPTDEEWSRAAGLAREEGATPKEQSGKNNVDFPWGRRYPPGKAKVGNYADSARVKAFPGSVTVEGYTDGYAATSPVGSFAPNPHGIYDLGGNVSEWCEDLYEPGGAGRVSRGASWTMNGRDTLLSSHRHPSAPSSRTFNHGFRCVVGASPR